MYLKMIHTTCSSYCHHRMCAYRQVLWPGRACHTQRSFLFQLCYEQPHGTHTVPHPAVQWQCIWFWWGLRLRWRSPIWSLLRGDTGWHRMWSVSRRHYEVPTRTGQQNVCGLLLPWELQADQGHLEYNTGNYADCIYHAILSSSCITYFCNFIWFRATGYANYHKLLYI